MHSVRGHRLRRNRWDSLRLFTPAQSAGLTGHGIACGRRHLPRRTEVARYLQAYAARFELPVLLSAAVTRLERDRRDRGDRFVAHTSQGLLHAHQVVVGTDRDDGTGAVTCGQRQGRAPTRRGGSDGAGHLPAAPPSDPGDVAGARQAFARNGEHTQTSPTTR